MNKIKIQYQKLKKATAAEPIKSYSELVKTAKTLFSNMPQNFYFKYKDDQDQITIDKDEDLKIFLNFQKRNALIVHPLYSSFSTIKNLSSSQNKSQSKSQLHNLISSINSSPIHQQTQNLESKLQVKQAQSKIEQIKTIHRDIGCKHCGLQIIGIRWKCLDQFDTDVCDNCYTTFRHQPGHNFLKIETANYLERLNYHNSIFKLFNPNYQPPKLNGLQSQQWIKEEDIIESRPNAISIIWQASKHIAERVAQQFNDWEREADKQRGMISL